MVAANAVRHPRRAGERTRDSLLAAIRERQRNGQPFPIMDELVADTGLPRSTVRHHVLWMAEHGIVQVRESLRPVIRHEIVPMEGGQE